MPGSRGLDARMGLELARLAETFVERWGASHFMTPRQAALMSTALALWDDQRFIFDELSENDPFDTFAPTVMMHVHDNKPWATAVYDRCNALHDMLTQGTNPLYVPHSFADEVLMVAACRAAAGLEGLHEDGDTWLPEARLRDGGDEEEDEAEEDPELARAADDEYGWECLEENIFEIAKHDDEVEAVFGDELLFGGAPRHPFKWFVTEDLWFGRPDPADTAAGEAPNTTGAGSPK